MTFVVCLLFSVGLFLAFEFAEESLFEEHLEADMNTFMDHYMVVPEIATLPRENFTVYIAENGDRSHFPDFLKNLPEGEEDVELDGKLLDVETRQRQHISFYFVIEETGVDSFENMLISSVIIIISIICICSIFLGYAFANRIIKPVSDLALRVNRLETTETKINMADTEGEDEIVVLSQAIDAFQHRVGELLEREREFSSDASHELRTPLMGIQAAAENLQVGDTDPRTMELAQRIEARCKQMRALIDSMLFLARDPHSLENDFEPVALINIVNDQIESASPHIESKGVETLIIENAKPVILSSAAILSVVFGNLLRNAVIHSQSKDIHINIFDHGFSIKDFGMGIEPDLKDQMFERYANSNSNSNDGFGIGLSLVKRLCDHFKWELTVETDIEVGTTITVNFGDSIKT